MYFFLFEFFPLKAKITSEKMLRFYLSLHYLFFLQIYKSFHIAGLVAHNNLVFKQNKKNIKFLEENVQKNDFMITHHLPSLKCVHSNWEKDPSNCYFVCPVDEIIHNNQPSYCLHGHSHEPCNIQIGNTICMRNPRGYPHEGVNFDPDFIIDTELEKVYT